MGVRRKDKNEEDLVSTGGEVSAGGEGSKRGERYMKFYCPLGVHVDITGQETFCFYLK